MRTWISAVSFCILTVAVFLAHAGVVQATSFIRDLTIGTTGTDVAALQRILITEGYSVPAGVTGYFGVQTKAAVAAWQTAHGIKPAAGYVGAQSRQYLETYSAVATPPAQENMATSSSATLLTQPLSLGDHGSMVIILQQLLRTLGYFTYPLNTGYFGSVTESAVRAFQRAHGIVSTGTRQSTGYGRVGPLTMQVLNQRIVAPGVSDHASNNDDHHVTATIVGIHGMSALPAPTSMSTIYVTSNGVALSWSAVPGATSYEIDRASSNGQFTALARGVIGTTYVDAAISPGSDYRYVVIAHSGTVASLPSVVLSVVVTQTGGGGGTTSAFQVADQTLEFGARTLAGAGAVIPVATGGTIATATIMTGNGAGHWQIASSGAITPTAAGQSAGLDQGPYTLGIKFGNGQTAVTATITIMIRNNTYTVANVTDLASVLALDEATKLSGTTMELRPGDYDTTSFTFWGHFTALTNTFTVTAADASSTPRVTSWYFGAPTGVTGNVTFRYIHFYQPQSEFAARGKARINSQIVLLQNTVPSAHITFDHDEFSSDMGPARLGTTTLTNEVRGIFCGGDCSDITVTDSTFHHLVYGIGVAGSQLRFMRNEFSYLWADPFDLYPVPNSTSSDIVIKDNYAHDFDGDGNVLHPDFIQAYRQGATVGSITNVTVAGNVVIPGYEGVRQLPSLGASVPVATTSIDSSLTTLSTTTLVRVDASAGDRTITLPGAAAFGSAGYVAVQKSDTTAHTVTVVTRGSDTIAGSGTTYVITRQWQTIAFTSDGTSSYAVQIGGPSQDGILAQTLNGGVYRDWTIAGNVIYATNQHGVTFEDPLTSSLIRNNTLLRTWAGDVNGDGVVDSSDGFMNYPEPGINLESTNDTNVVVEDNVMEELTTSVSAPAITARNNNTTPAATNIATYQSLFQGSTFDPRTKSDALADALMKPSAALDVDHSGDPTLGDIGAVGTSITNGFYDFSGHATNTAFLVPRLTHVTGVGTTTTTADLSVVTDTPTGVLYWVVSTSTVVPTASEIVAGHDGGGLAAAAGSRSVASYGVASATASTLTASTTYYAYFVQVASTGTSTVAGTNAFVTKNTGYNEHLVSFANASTYLSRSGNLVNATNTATGLVFTSFVVPTSVTAYGAYILDTGLSSGHFVYLYPGTTASSTARVYVRVPDTTGAGTICVINGATAVHSGQRVNLLLSIDGTNKVCKDYLWAQTTGWVLDGSQTKASTFLANFTPGNWSVAASLTGAYAFKGTMARTALWTGLSLPDISQLSVQAKFADVTTGQTVDPSTSVGTYGVPIIDFYGLASTWNAGTNQGSGGTFIGHGTVVDVP